MSAITPSTNVKLLKLPIELDNENQLTFASATAQYNYFNSLTKLAVDKFTYQRKDGVIRFPANVDDVIQYNYVMYQNTAFSNKWFYAYVDRMEFVNPNTTDVYIRTDPFQTWQFDITFKESFVEREHVNDDTIGKNTTPESLQLGEYVCHINGNFDIAKQTNYYCAVGTTEMLGELKDGSNNSVTPASKINGCPQGLYYVLFSDSEDARNYANAFAGSGKKDAVCTMFLIPTSVFWQTEGGSTTIETVSVTWTYSFTDGSGTSHSYSIDCKAPKTSNNEAEMINTYTPVQIPRPSGFYFNSETYTPRNNKLYTYPYCYLTITNNNGTAVNYHFEDFVNGHNYVEFCEDGCFASGGGLKLYPYNYKNALVDTSNSYMFGINSGKFPMLSWTSDQFTNWLTQNSVNIGLNVAGTTLSGAIVGGAPMAAAGFVGSAFKAVGEIDKASKMPDQVKGDYNNGDLMFAKNRCAFSAYIMTIKPEYAKIIDKYFDMFGYKVSITKTPNITGRTNWNYVKTIRGKIHGYIPKEDLNTITEMLDNGVTFWHNASTFLDYSQSNNIIS